MKPTDLTALTASIKKEIKLTVPSRVGKTTFSLRGIDPNKRTADKFAYELRRKNPKKIVKVMKRKLRYAVTYAIYISMLS
jgi:hypothetical protein